MSMSRRGKIGERSESFLSLQKLQNTDWHSGSQMSLFLYPLCWNAAGGYSIIWKWSLEYFCCQPLTSWGAGPRSAASVVSVVCSTAAPGFGRDVFFYHLVCKNFYLSSFFLKANQLNHVKYKRGQAVVCDVSHSHMHVSVCVCVPGNVCIHSCNGREHLSLVFLHSNVLVAKNPEQSSVVLWFLFWGIHTSAGLHSLLCHEKENDF